MTENGALRTVHWTKWASLQLWKIRTLFPTNVMFKTCLMQPGVHTITLSVETDADSWECWHGTVASICKISQTSVKSAVHSLDGVVAFKQSRTTSQGPTGIVPLSSLRLASDNLLMTKCFPKHISSIMLTPGIVQFASGRIMKMCYCLIKMCIGFCWKTIFYIVQVILVTGKIWGGQQMYLFSWSY